MCAPLGGFHKQLLDSKRACIHSASILLRGPKSKGFIGMHPTPRGASNKRIECPARQLPVDGTSASGVEEVNRAPGKRIRCATSARGTQQVHLLADKKREYPRYNTNTIMRKFYMIIPQTEASL